MVGGELAGACSGPTEVRTHVPGPLPVVGVLAGEEELQSRAAGGSPSAGGGESEG